VTLNQLPDKLKQDGINYADFRQQLRDQIIIQKLQQQLVQDQMRISPREVEAQLKLNEESGESNTQYHLSQILIATPFNPTADQVAAAHKKAQAIYEKLEQGADFAATAIATSDGQQALKGGDLGWRKQSELPTIFTNIIISMKPGDISEPVQSPSGFHIVKVDDVKHQDDKVVVTQTHARHILIKTSALMTDDQAKAKLEEVRKQILGGADFAKLAKEYSDDTGSASDGGDLGWVDPGATVPIFEQEMNKLQVGQISEPFKSQYGWHIVQVLGRRKSDQTEEARKNKAYDAIYARKSDEILQDWLGQLRGSAYIEYHLDDSSSQN
ncbi:MAG: peptidylprolyl isomerase, partial [Gammaproteobacteria bacterium]